MNGKDLEAGPAAIAGDDGTVHEMGIVTGKEQCDIGDILRHTHFRGVGQQGTGAFKAKFVCLRHHQWDISQNTTG